MFWTGLASWFPWPKSGSLSALTPQGQSWLVLRKMLWPAKAEIFRIWPFPKMFANPCFKWSGHRCYFVLSRVDAMSLIWSHLFENRQTSFWMQRSGVQRLPKRDQHSWKVCAQRSSLELHVSNRMGKKRSSPASRFSHLENACHRNTTYRIILRII